MADSEQQEYLENAASVFHNIDLLHIKKSYGLLCEMEEGAIEQFVAKYSDFVIFLLNILDPGRSNHLLGRLTEASIVYVMEEETRTLMIKDVAAQAMRGEDFANLSLFLDRVDRPPAPGEDFDAGARSILEGGAELRRSLKREHFAYLEALERDRLERVLAFLVERNHYVALAMLLYCNEARLGELLDALAQYDAKLLGYVPHEFFGIRFSTGWSAFTDSEVRKSLPAEARATLERILAFRATNSALLQRVRQLSSAESDPVRRRKLVIESLASGIGRGDAGILKYVFADLISDGILDPADLRMIETVTEKSDY
ncbi:MAG: hypothetical protein H7A21_03275 [Spirochaetales bacterium]|nr:hypothetical protein [Leptospiraceae bacterium]MCP5480430.1 hypothetical protein [Spirochaetales bacterium]